MSAQLEVHTAQDVKGFLTDFDLYLFNEGTHTRVYEKLGVHLIEHAGQQGAHFALWAPNAQQVYVSGDFNNWQLEANPLNSAGRSGVWSGFIPGVQPRAAYRFHIVSARQDLRLDKRDPCGFRQEASPRNCSFVWPLGYAWDDSAWMDHRARFDPADSAISIYEVDLGSWMRVPEQGNRRLTFRELAPRLVDYVRKQGFTHVELLPVMEHPLEGHAFYQTTGYYAPAARFGEPQDLMFLIDTLHQNAIGVILDWAPAHFPADEHGLGYFDGTHLYEIGLGPLQSSTDAKRFSFDFAKGEVRSFLVSNALFWLDKYHADGLRVDDVSSLLHLDYGRQPGNWLPNRIGGRENSDGIEFVRQLNNEIARYYPGAMSIARETSSWPMTTHSTAAGGLGFHFQWDQAFPQKIVPYFSIDPFFRKLNHEAIVSRGAYWSSERFVLPLSHEEVQRGRGSLLARMHGDEWQRLANLRLLLAFLYLQPGKKLLFQGTDFAQWNEWNPDTSVDWHLCQYPQHAGVQQWVRDLNRAYREELALHRGDTSLDGFEWENPSDAEQSTLSWFRRAPQRREVLLVVCNFTPVVRRNYLAGVRRAGNWRELLNSDAKEYGGSGQGNFGGVTTAPLGIHQLPHTLTLTLPPLAAVVFKHEV